jgi:hypothetical protein
LVTAYRSILLYCVSLSLSHRHKNDLVDDQ